MAPPGRRERRRTETRARILQAALALFTQQGFVNTTVEQITESADVAKGTFFNYFPSKDAVVEAMIQQQLSGMERTVEKAQHAPSVRPLLLRMMQSFSGQGPARSPIMLRSILGVGLLNEAMCVKYREVILFARKVVQPILVRGQKLGEIRRDIPVEELVRIVQESVWGTHLLWALVPETQLESALDTSFEVLWSGLSATAGPRKKREEL